MQTTNARFIKWLQRLTLLLFISQAVTACGRTDAQGTNTPPPLEGDQWTTAKPDKPINEGKLIALRAMPNAVRLPIAGSRDVQVEAIYDNGTREDVSQTLEWTIDNDQIAKYEAGRVVALSPGKAQIDVRYGGLRTEIFVDVLDKKITRLSIEPKNAVVPINGQIVLKVQGTYDDGSNEEVTQLVTWAAEDPTVALVSNEQGQEGQVKGLTSGRTRITAKIGDVEDDATITVSDEANLVQLTVWPAQTTLLPGTSQPIEATGVYSDGSTINLSDSVTWRSQDDNIATVSLQDTWRIEAKSPGATIIEVTYQEFTAQTSIIVSDATLNELYIFPNQLTLPVLGQKQLVAYGKFNDGSQLDLTQLVTWSTDDARLASIDREGLVRARASGVVTLNASIQGKMATARLTVSNADLVRVDVEPIDPILGLNMTQHFVAIGHFEDGTSAEITQAVNWAASDENIAKINEDGQLFTRGEGTSVITASIRDATGRTRQGVSTITVLDQPLNDLLIEPNDIVLGVNQRETLRATGKLADGTELDLTQSVSWLSGSPDVVAISNEANTKGQLKTLKLGGSVILATIGQYTAQANVLVDDRRLIKLEVEPPTLSLPAGTTLPLEVTGTYSDNSERKLTRQVQWSSDKPFIATPLNQAGQEGRLKALSPGTAVITASLDGVSATLDVTVTDAVLVDIKITPKDATIQAGDEGQYSATGVFSDGSSVYVTREVTWSTGNANIARMQNGPEREGYLKAISAGTTTVTARMGNVIGTTNVTVQGSPLNRIVLNPQMATTPIGSTRQFSARAIYDDGSSRNITGLARWSTSDRALARISTLGKLTARAEGEVTVRVEFENKSAEVQTTITATELVDLQVTPNRPVLAQNGLLKFWATAIYSDGTREDVTEGVDWATSDPAVMTITRNPRWPGIAQAVGPGTATITAKYKGLTGEAVATVTGANLVELKISPIDVTVAPGTEMQYFVQAIFDDGTSRDVTFLASWRAENDPIADVRNGWREKGKVIARREGTTKVYALYQNIRAEAQLTVTEATVVQVQVAPFSPTVNEGDLIRFWATAIYSDGTAQQISQDALWQSDDTDLATVSNTRWYEGLVTTHKAGKVKILATYQGVTGTSELTITGLQITQIQVTPFIETIPQGYYLRMLATAIYSNGSSRDITGLATWTSTDPMVGDVHASFWVKGWVKGLSSGSTFVEATYQGVTGTARLTVTDATLASIEVTPNTSQIKVAETVKFEAEGTFTDGSKRDVTHYLTWSSSDQQVGDVSNAWVSRGEATGFTPGTITIKAQQGNISGQATLTVTP